jgi:hypothetical protein
MQARMDLVWRGWQAIGLCIALAACSSEPKPSTAPPPPPPPPPPEIAKALPAIKTVVDRMNLPGPFQFAGPFATSSRSDPPHFFCLKSNSESRFTITLFFKGDKYESARIATPADHCDGAPYQALPIVGDPATSSDPRAPK